MCFGAASVGLTLTVGLVLGALAIQSGQAQTFAILHTFCPKIGCSDGSFPYAGLIRDRAGNLYGTTKEGGSSDFGTVFEVDTSGTETVLYSFTGGNDGGYPYASLIRDPAGNLYGTTEAGGSSAVGTVFKLDTSGTETVLHSFPYGPTDGCYPYAGLIRRRPGISTAVPRNAALPTQGQCSSSMRAASRPCCTASPDTQRTGRIPTSAVCSWTRRTISTASRNTGARPM